MSLYAWITFIAITAVQAGSPGPSTLNLIRNSIRYGSLRSIIILTGDVFAILLMGFISSLGIATFFANNPKTFMALKLAGAVYLIYLGIAAYIKSCKPTALNQAASTTGGTNLASEWLRSFFIGMSNPKSMIYFAALLPQFQKGGEPDFAFFSILVLCSGLIKLTILSTYALLAKWMVGKVSSPSAGKLGSRLVAAFFVLFGATVAFTAFR
ncbi:LysE family translocator [Pseudomonas oryzihabitans]|uniref:LysE family translocator n=1 Tax=Pseudomonas oryzihabitans TaxID=47885 RepID=UPI00285B05CC|nr:LysE family translocator [Pseudomonas psychrotolerans]MDR6680226.1 threonine/homoserine/homoserine lactone efflux protein [Pseudomonas psychrotolerans]